MSDNPDELRKKQRDLNSPPRQQDPYIRGGMSGPRNTEGGGETTGKPGGGQESGGGCMEGVLKIGVTTALLGFGLRAMLRRR